MSMRIALALALGLGIGQAGSAAAATVPGTLDLAIVSSDAARDVAGGGRLDAEGTGFRGDLFLPVADTVYLHGEYETVDFDYDANAQISEEDLSFVRGGLGMTTDLNDLFQVRGRVDYVHVRSAVPGLETSEQNGVGANVALVLMPWRRASVAFDMGIFEFEDASGSEFALSGHMRLTRMVAAYARLRNFTLEYDGSDEFDVTQIEAGLRLVFHPDYD